MQKVGLIGLGVMGKSLALNLLDKGFQISVFNRQVKGLEEDIAKKFEENNADSKGFDDLKLFVLSLEKPRKILLMVNAGKAVEEVIEHILPYLEKGDLLMDGGNSDYTDTKRRITRLDAMGIHYLGIGISGGEEGARKGPSIMPGGSLEGYKMAYEFLNAIAAKDASNKPCSTYIGPDGSGHFVKMVHNGIEYAEMQIIAEAYYLLRDMMKMSPDKIAAFFKEWRNAGLNNYLLEISTEILVYKEGDEYLLDKILDAAEQKGTGGLSSKVALELGIPLNTIYEAVTARMISAMKQQRSDASNLYQLHKRKLDSSMQLMDELKNAYAAARIINHAIGFAMIQKASNEDKWNLNLSELARIWTNGCIIRSELMEKLVGYFDSHTNLLFHPEIVKELKSASKDLTKIVSIALQNGYAIPVFSSALNYFLSITTEQSSANLIQAQRDYFGAHMYKRIDKAEDQYFHTEWTSLK